MKLSKLVSTFVVAAIVSMPMAALARYTVTFTNEGSEAMSVYAESHKCIHHPSRFDITVEPGKAERVEADWSSDHTCGTLAGAPIYMRVCIKGKDNPQNCSCIQPSNGIKEVTLLNGTISPAKECDYSE